MKSSHTRLTKWLALVTVGAAVAATSAQAGGTPPDPGWAAFPHCTVPNVEGKQLAAARTSLRGSLCGVLSPIRTRSTAARDTVLVAVPEARLRDAPQAIAVCHGVLFSQRSS